MSCGNEFSGFVPEPFSNRVPNEYCALCSSPLSVEMMPLPSFKLPCHSADALRFISFAFRSKYPADRISLVHFKRQLHHARNGSLAIIAFVVRATFSSSRRGLKSGQDVAAVFTAVIARLDTLATAVDTESHAMNDQTHFSRAGVEPRHDTPTFLGQFHWRRKYQLRTDVWPDGLICGRRLLGRTRDGRDQALLAGERVGTVERTDDDCHWSDFIASCAVTQRTREGEGRVSQRTIVAQLRQTQRETRIASDASPTTVHEAMEAVAGGGTERA